MSNALGITPAVNAATYRCVVAAMAAMLEPKTIVEVGVWNGDLSRMFVETCPHAKLWLIDSWEPFHQKDREFDKAEVDRVASGVMQWAQTTGGRVEVIRARSLDAVERFIAESVDFVHIDDDKTSDTIAQNLAAWWKRMAPGGVLCGDNFEDAHIAESVALLFPQHRLTARSRVWWVRK